MVLAEGVVREAVEVLREVVDVGRREAGVGLVVDEVEAGVAAALVVAVVVLDGVHREVVGLVVVEGVRDCMPMEQDGNNGGSLGVTEWSWNCIPN